MILREDGYKHRRHCRIVSPLGQCCQRLYAYFELVEYYPATGLIIVLSDWDILSVYSDLSLQAHLLEASRGMQFWKQGLQISRRYVHRHTFCSIKYLRHYTHITQVLLIELVVLMDVNSR